MDTGPRILGPKPKPKPRSPLFKTLRPELQSNILSMGLRVYEGYVRIPN